MMSRVPVILMAVLFTLLSLSTQASLIDSAGSVGDYSSDNLVITSFQAADGQMRTRFLYRL